MNSLVLGAFLVAAPAPSTSTVKDDLVPFDAKNYPLETLHARRRRDPCGKGGELKDVLFSAELRWHGEVAPTPAPDVELLRRWTKDIGDPEAVAKYAQLVSFSEGRRFERLAAPEGLLAFMEMDLLPGDRVILYLVHVGCAEGRAVFAVDEYDVTEQDELEKDDELI
ncbi:MAG: hypothetical protein HYZ75_17425 [Elusimicrobia bacterium]|nr:hypothetical protein [Elusimicrobiota bacterium]